MNTYKTSEIANMFGIHPNTVRLYEKLELIPKAKRQKNGYRIFTDFHIKQIELARLMLEIEILQNGLRKQAISIIKTSAMREFEKAISMIASYIEKISHEQDKAEEAIIIVNELLSGQVIKEENICLTRKKTADYLEVKIDTLRNWELNGLITVKRKSNGYRIYQNKDIRKLKIIRSLRFANYSLSAILRLLNTISVDPNVSVKEVINTPNENENIISACDKLLTSLHHAEKNAHNAFELLNEMKNINI